jgi:hypothetical protein
MKDGFDVVTDVRSLINVPAVLSLITGKVYPGVRPSSSIKSDIVVRTNGGTNTQDQAFYVYINCYYPNETPTIDGKLQSLPDYAKLSTLAKAITPLVEEVYKSTFRCWIEETPILMQDTDGAYFISIRLRYQSIQSNYNNI